MSPKKIYNCQQCSNTTTLLDGEKTPVCCEKEMLLDPLEPCTSADHAEMVRNTDDSDACDDGRGHYD